MNFLQKINTLYERNVPEEGTLVGYGAIIEYYNLTMPLPQQLALISSKKRKYSNGQWKVFSAIYMPEDTLYKQLVFALRYEGINLLFFKKLFEKLSEKEIIELLQIEPSGQYSRKIWFLYEWLLKKLDIPDLKTGNYIPIIDTKLQYAIKGKNSPRYRIINNLPGTKDFCPLIDKTEKLEKYINSNLSEIKNNYTQGIRKDILQRASTFLLLKDSKASFSIEGENTSNNRALRWGKAIGQAGSKALSIEELNRLQNIVIESSRFTNMGFRSVGGFVGEHDRITGEPLPEHISAKWQDIENLINGLIDSYKKMETMDFDAVLTAVKISFGFVFIHPYEDGNGRIHRYLIHHILAKMGYTQQGLIFPISASILNHINDYRSVLEHYSNPILEFIKWKKTPQNNIDVLNDTIDFYKYFNATKQAEFIYFCVEDTMTNIIPAEIDYLQKYDEMKYYLDNTYEMPDKTIALLIRFLEQNNGKLSKRAIDNEFSELEMDEINNIENMFKQIFLERMQK